MRENKVKRKLAEGGIAVGTMMLEFNSTGIPQLAAEAGAEFAVFDMEHTGWSLETIRMLMTAAKSADLVTLVRPPTTEYDLIARVLDCGAMGVVLPFVNTAEQARFIVSCVKYPPVGRRGTIFSAHHDDYRGGNLAEKMQQINRESMIVAQIETVQGLENLDEIAAVEGIDVIWIGQFDLTTSMGIPGQFTHPEFLRAVDRIRLACDKHGKAPGYGTFNLDELCQRKEQGFRYLVYTADLWIYQKALREGVDRVRKTPEKTG